MTAKKDLKRRVRQRQEKTGESYTTARAHVLADRDDPAEPHEEPKLDPAEPKLEPAEPKLEPAFPVVELIDATEQAHQLGMKCTAHISPSVVARVPVRRVLERLRDALLATESDPQTALFRTVIFRGEQLQVAERRHIGKWWEDARRFIARAQAGIGGTNDHGDMLALQIDGHLVIAQVGYLPRLPPMPKARARVFILDLEGHKLGENTVVGR